MALTWDLNSVFKKMEDSGIERPEQLLISNGELNAMSMGVVMSTAAVGINKLTDKNFKEFHQRLKKLEIVGSTLLKKEEDDEGESIQRNPTLPEIKAHIGLKTNAPTMDKKKFNASLMQIIDNRVQELIKIELDELKEMENSNADTE
tara:strand:- start:2042 stop:2482 length:441 start_codon:yes stop_codon:yes gene_type:complete